MSSMKNQINEVIKEDMDESMRSGKTEKGHEVGKDDEYEEDFVEPSKLEESGNTETKKVEASIGLTPETQHVEEHIEIPQDLKIQLVDEVPKKEIIREDLE